MCILFFLPVGLRVPNRNYTDFSLLKVDFKRRKCPSARCASAANAIDSDTDMFNRRAVLLNDWLVSLTFTA
jgi:hypothetical protein